MSKVSEFRTCKFPRCQYKFLTNSLFINEEDYYCKYHDKRCEYCDSFGCDDCDEDNRYYKCRKEGCERKICIYRHLPNSEYDYYCVEHDERCEHCDKFGCDLCQGEMYDINITIDTNYNDNVKKQEELEKQKNSKLPLQLVPPQFKEGIAKVFQSGVNKGYLPNDWIDNKNLSSNVLVGAQARHMAQWESGTDNDDESGLCHLYHAATNCLMLAYRMEYNENHVDDRIFKKRKNNNKDE